MFQVRRCVKVPLGFPSLFHNSHILFHKFLIFAALFCNHFPNFSNPIETNTWPIVNAKINV